MSIATSTILVTGGGTGLGREIARQAARAGSSIAIGYSRSADDADATVRELRDDGVQAVAMQADLAVAGAAVGLIERTISTFGRLDVLVNNAGTTRAIPFDDLDAVTETDWDQMFAVNVRGPFELARAAATELRSTKGSIVNIGSIAGLRPAGSSIPYCVSKAALDHLTRCLAVAFAPHVRVNTVAPGLMQTRWTRAILDQLDEIASDALLERTSGLDDVAATVLATAANRSITGQRIVVDAGLVLR